jgi:uroporphyrinogen-III synthase
MRVIVTRPETDALRTADRLAGMGLEPVLSPVLVVRATGTAVPNGPFDGVLATSANAFLDAFPPSLTTAPLFAVGEATAAAGRRAGFSEVHTSPGRAYDVAEDVRRLAPARARLLYLAGRARTDTLETRLAEAGFHLTVIETYAADPAEALAEQAISALRQDSPMVLHYSARSAEIFLRLAIRAGLFDAVLRCAHLCLSEAVARPLREAGAQVRVAPKADEGALLALLPPSS